ncbi:MAG TPA: hypothetical protein VEJ23_03835 [Solirubrobacteraceae bacterium]|nr:hypothetical protein [Solirubrobacteraceae bacterium]
MRTSFLAFIVGALVLLAAAPAAYAAGSFEKFFAGNCNAASETCGKGAKEGTPKEAKEQGELHSGAFVPFGVTDFKLAAYPANNETFAYEPHSTFFAPIGFPTENLKNLRVDVAPGVVTNPQSVPKCSEADFMGVKVAEVKGVPIFTAPTCPKSTYIGKNEVTTISEVHPPKWEDVELTGKVYNLEQKAGQGSTYGVALEVGGGLVTHTIIEGSVEFASDYHDYFVIKNISAGLIESRLLFYGNKNPENSGAPTTFIRNGTKCAVVGAETTTVDRGEFVTGASEERPYTSLAGGEGCSGLAFEPSFTLTPESAFTDGTDGITTETKATHPAAGAGNDTADLSSITVKMPEGMTMNPSAAASLEGCEPAQAETNTPSTAFEIAKLNPIACPSGSKIGTVNLEVPTAPEGALQGPIFLGKPAGKPIEGPPYTIYLDAESTRYGVRTLLKGSAMPNLSTGQLTVTFNENPQAPFNNVKLHFNGGAFAPIANPLVCGNTGVTPEFASFPSPNVSGKSFLPGPSTFTTIGCASSPPPFAPSQSSSVLPAVGGSTTNLTFTLVRPEGQQYVNSLSTTLPPGLYAKIPAVPTLCSEAQVNAHACPAASLVGTVTAKVGSGKPYPFGGLVYLTGPDQGAPYGLQFEVPVEAGPFNLGVEHVHAKIEVNPNTAQVVVTSPVPTIKAGIPTRLRELTVNLTRANYVLNPTNCGQLKFESTATSTLGASSTFTSPFQVEGCSSLPYKPTFVAKTSGKYSKANGASLETTFNTPEGSANSKSVLVQLPKQLPSRLTTLQKACTEKQFAENPLACPPGSKVGSARANTILLPGKLQGPAIFVSHGGEAFPDLDLVLEANGIRVIVVGHTKITKGITTTNFESTPDSPVSSITVVLPLASNSALAANGNLCTQSLVMPTTITAQNGKVFKQNTKIQPVNCGIQVVGHKTAGNVARITVQTYGAGRVSGSGSGLSTAAKWVNGATRTTIDVPLTSSARQHKPKTVRVRIGFFPKKKGAATSVAYQSVRFP